MKKRKLSCSIGFEQLELRRLLAADCGMQAMPEVVTKDPVQCEVVSFECSAEDMTPEPVTESPADVIEAGTATPDLDPRILDLADGMDGYFGSVNAENSAETLEFTVTGDGMVDVALASSFGDANTWLSVSNAEGDAIETQSEDLEGFAMFSFEVEEGESYQLSITSDDAKCEGHFQLTVGFEAHVDQHSNELGSESTELELVDNASDLSGRLEATGDVDTFRFTATDNGEITLELHETVDDARIGLHVVIQNSEGDVLADGATNEMLQISFDVERGQEYFVSLEAGEGQKGTYSFGLDLIPNQETPAAEIIDGDVADESIAPDVVEPDVMDPEISHTESATGQETADDVSDPATGGSSETAIVSDLDEPQVDVDSELVDANDETAESDTTEETGLPGDCDIVESDGDVSEIEITDEPIANASTEEIGEDVDQQQGDQPTEGALVDLTVEQPNDDLATAWADCSGDESIDSEENPETELESNTELDLESNQDDLILDSGDEVSGNVMDNDEPFIGFDNLEAVDDFFADFGNQIEMHFDFFFGQHDLDWISSLA